ncbi:glycosyltransferase family 39 protein [Novosphingobium sp.]|uniref:ArnT family glycosyltransferase n=1 Tax=Novosphingobium sp. TaxID=1874826 RepID=UPI0027353CE4|nr:glycosyltransferase family 39 protein [Novosphingobium sp.]MDP3906896.1 glycosyltransferase family 39 protein [Novosphingobium sp.]
MTAPVASTVSAPQVPARPLSERWLFAAFALAVLLQLELVFNRPVNWDEFYHLTEAHAFHQGRLTETLQVLYARAFFWLPLLPVDAVDQVRVARLFMLACELFTVWAIFAMASRFVTRTAAMVAALAYLTGGYVFQHGMSFRADPMAAAFLMGTLYILLTSRLNWLAIALAGFLTGLAFLTTIKIVLYAPAFAAIAWLRWVQTDDRRDLIVRGAAFTGAALAFSAVLVGLTMLTLPPEDPAAAHAAAQRLSSSGTMMFDMGLFPRWGYALAAIAFAPVLGIIVLRTPFDLRTAPYAKADKIALLLLMGPLLSISFYSNSLPYFYTFILPPVMVGAAIGADVMQRRFGLGLITAALLANAAIISLGTPRSVLTTQKQVLAAVAEIFPQPVAYFDFPGMIAHFPKANFFMTNWGVRKYWDGLEPSFGAVMASETVPLLILNQEPLTRNQTEHDGAWEFTPADRVALREGFIPHWGPLWVAGQRLAGGELNRVITIRTPGTYTIEGAAVRIGGQVYRAGSTVEFARGPLRVERTSPAETVLRWGDHLPKPAAPYRGDPVMQDF